MSSAAVGTHSGAGSLSLMSCVRESSPLQDYEIDGDKCVATKKRFWNPKKWFKRKNKISEDVVLPVEIGDINSKDDLRSRSTSELSIAEEQIRRRSGSSMHPGLSVSHDSVFHSPNSDSDIDLDVAQSSSSLLSISQHQQVDVRLQTELSERLRLRRGRGDTSEDDEGLPHSPCNSPTTTDALLRDKTAIKDLPGKSHSTCSDGSLLSMGSSDMDEEFFGSQSRHSSKLSLYEKRSTDQDFDLEFHSHSISLPLNHSAAHHKVAVKPKRTHGVPRRKRVPQLSAVALPTTLEVNEESSVRSMTPENISKEAASISEYYSSMSTTTSAARTLTTTTTNLTETQLKCSSLPPGLVAPSSSSSSSRIGGDYNNKLNRSRSNAGSKSQDHFITTLEEDVEKEEKTDKSFFDRIFPRRSAKKKQQQQQRAKEEKITSTSSSGTTTVSAVNSAVTVRNTSTSSSKHIIIVDGSSTKVKSDASKPIAAPRSGAASRQRIQPIDIPASPNILRRDDNNLLPSKLSSSSSPDNNNHKGFGVVTSTSTSTSPLQIELETRIKQRQQTTSIATTSPPLSPTIINSPPPQSPKSFINVSSSMVQSSSHSKIERESILTSKNVEIRSKMKIPGLSSLQQRVLSLNEDETDENDSCFKSLTDLPDDDSDFWNSKPVAKSQSFKSTKAINDSNNYYCLDSSINSGYKFSSSIVTNLEQSNKKRLSMIAKAASLDSVKYLDEPSDQQQQQVTNLVKELKFSNDLVKKKNVEQNDDGITISGPSHTAVVNISNRNSSKLLMEQQSSMKQEMSIKESVSITKIQLKRDSTLEVVAGTTNNNKTKLLPEFLNRQLNKVEAKPISNVVLSMNSTSPPRIIDEQSRPKLSVNFDLLENNSQKITGTRKFSQENLEIVDREPQQQQTNEIVDESTKIEDSLVNVLFTTTLPPIAAAINNNNSRYKKNETNMKRKSSSESSSGGGNKTPSKSRSISLDSLKSDDNNIKLSSQDDNSLTTSDQDESIMITTPATVKERTNSITEQVILRKRSLIHPKNDDEPELMKVFARRSLKLKDSETELISQQVNSMIIMSSSSSSNDDNAANIVTITDDDNIIMTSSSDKENQFDSPVEERKKSKQILNETNEQQQQRKSVKNNYLNKLDVVQNIIETTTTTTVPVDVKEMLVEITTPPQIGTVGGGGGGGDDESESEVILRKPPPIGVNNNNNNNSNNNNNNNNNSNNYFAYQRTVSLNPPLKSHHDVVNDLKVRKQASFSERRKNDSWINNNNKNSGKISTDEIITSISPKSDFITEEFLVETKNFNQRKAEWEKRAQEAQKKSVP